MTKSIDILGKSYLFRFHNKIWSSEFELNNLKVSLEIEDFNSEEGWRKVEMFIKFLIHNLSPNISLKAEPLLNELATLFWEKKHNFIFSLSGVNFNISDSENTRFNYELVFDLSFENNEEWIQDYSSWCVSLSNKKIIGCNRYE